MKLRDIIFDYLPHSADGLDKPFRVLGDPHVRIIDRRLSHTNSGDVEESAEGETIYYYYVLVCGFDVFEREISLNWHPEEKVTRPFLQSLMTRRCDVD